MFLVALQPDGAVVPLEPTAFDLEVDLQLLLRDYPKLLLAPVPAYRDREIWTIGFEVATDAGSIDLLCIDSTAEIWVVETKLAKNPEVRKQVVGQVLGYASSVSEWSVDRLDAATQEFLGEPLLTYLARHLATDDSDGMEEAEELVNRTIEKMRQGDLTAVVVVDRLNPVLQRLVEFVNAHASFDLLAVTVNVIEHEETRLVLPSVVGTVAAKTVSGAGTTTERLDDLMSAADEEFHTVLERLRNWGDARGHRINPTKKGYRILSADGHFIAQLYPRWGSVNIGLDTMIKVGMTSEADRIRDRFALLFGKQPEMGPHFDAPAVLEHWDEFVPALDAYVEGRLEAARRLEEPNPTQG